MCFRACVLAWLWVWQVVIAVLLDKFVEGEDPSKDADVSDSAAPSRGGAPSAAAATAPQGGRADDEMTLLRQDMSAMKAKLDRLVAMQTQLADLVAVCAEATDAFEADGSSSLSKSRRKSAGGAGVGPPSDAPYKA